MMNSEEAFLFATFKEFHKCWRSGTKARVIIESVNGKAFVNFTAFLGDPGDAHFKPRPSKRNPPKRPKGRLQKKKTSYLVTLSQLPFTHPLTRLIVTSFNSDKVVSLGPIHSLEK